MKALITGASSGIGLDMAKYLATKKCELILVARNKEKLDTTVEEETEEDTKSVLSTDIEIKGPAGINAEPLLPQF